MLRSYLTIIGRNLFNNKFVSFVNLIGLVTGLTACIFLIQFVSFELSFDDFHINKDRIYRVTNDRFQEGKRIHHGVTTYPAVGLALLKDYPEIELHTRMMLGFSEINVRIDDEIFSGGNYLFADNNFFSVFTFKLAAGDPRTVLSQPYAVVLSERFASKYFGTSTEDLHLVIGKQLYFNLNNQPYVVTGVLKDIPHNSHLRFDALISYATLINNFPIADNSWTWSDMRHYIVLKPGADKNSWPQKLTDFSKRYFKGTQVTGSREEFFLQPLTEVHLYSDYEYDIAVTSDENVVWGMAVVALFILVLAWINYVNLTIAHSVKRAKEVSLRKIMGAFRVQVTMQFLMESLVWIGGSLVLAIGAVMLLQPSFNQLLDAPLSLLNMFSNWSLEMVSLLGASVLLSVGIACLYPASILSSDEPVAILNGKFRYASKKQIQKGLVIFQFMANATLLISTIVISKQLNYLNQVDMGLDIHNTMVIKAPVRTAWDSTFTTRIENFKAEMLQVKGVLNVTTSNKLPGERLPRIFKVHVKDRPSEDYHTMSTTGVGMDFFETYKIRLLAGRTFTQGDYKNRWPDITSLMINERAVRNLGFTSVEQALGQEIFLENRFFTVVGVVNDFHQESLKSIMEPMLFRPAFGNAQSVSLKLEEFNPEIIKSTALLFDKFFPDNGFDYYSLEANFKNKYSDDQRFNKVIRIFSFIAMALSCLGLIGLSTFTLAQRTKEIGIRKIVGASFLTIFYLLSFDFIILVLMGLVFAIPLAYLVMQDWLSGYIYHISVSPIYFILPSLGILMIALLTISFQVVRTALINPCETIRHQ